MSKGRTAITAPILILVIYILLILSRLLDMNTLIQNDSVFLALAVIEMMIFVLPGIFYCKLKGTGYVSATNLRPFGIGSVPIMAFTFFAMVCGSIILQFLLYRAGIITAADGSYQAYAYFESSGDFSDLKKILYAALFFAVVPALCEEFVFRGILMTEYAPLGGISAVTASALLFAMSHFNLSQLIIYFVLGILLSGITYITRSAFPAIILHTLFNIYSLFCQRFVWALIVNKTTLIFFLFVVSSAFLLFLMLACGEAERITRGYGLHGIHSEAEKLSKRTQKPIIETLLSPTFLVCCAFYIVISVVMQ